MSLVSGESIEGQKREIIEKKRIPIVLKKKLFKFEAPVVMCLKGKRESWGQNQNDLYIGRALNMGGWKLANSKWSNPFKIKDYNNDVDQVLELYRNYVENKIQLKILDLHELSGQRLGCWCKVKGHEPCHGDILVELYHKYLG